MEFGNLNLLPIFKRLIMLVGLSVVSVSWGAVDPLSFESADQEARFRAW